MPPLSAQNFMLSPAAQILGAGNAADDLKTQVENELAQRRKKQANPQDSVAGGNPAWMGGAVGLLGLAK